MVAGELAAKRCVELGWVARPLWSDVAAGLRLPERPRDLDAIGEWQHGWQFHASEQAAVTEWNHLLQALARPGARVNAACPGKARLQSCRGPFSGTWLTVCPTTEALTMADPDFQIAVRRRLGIATCMEGPDPHGHSKLATAFGGGMQARHSKLLTAWKQIFIEAGGQIPRRNVERLLRTTWVRVPSWDNRRLDLVVAGLSVSRGLPLFCDVTILSPITRAGQARAGTSNRGGSLLERAENENNETYHEVVDSSLASLQCLSCEVYGRWGKQCVELVPKLAVERARGLPSRVRRGAALMFQRRWWGILSVALQTAVAHMAVRGPEDGVDLYVALSEPSPALASLEVLA